MENNQDQEVFKNDIDMYLKLWCETYKVDDVCKMSQMRWYALCKYIYNNIFKINPIYLKDSGYINNNNTPYQYYNSNKVLNILNIYIDLCYTYEKVVNITGFCQFTGIHRDTINEWKNHGAPGSTSMNSDVYKILKQYDMETTDILAQAGKINTVAAIAHNNFYNGWDKKIYADRQEVLLTSRRSKEDIKGLLNDKSNSFCLPATDKNTDQ